MSSADRPADLTWETEDELRDILAERESVLHHLLEEVERLERAPQHYEARLRRLEKYFADLRPEDAVRLHSPALHAVGKVMKDDEARQIAEDVAHKRIGVVHRHHGVGVEVAEGHTDTSNLVLGQGYMPIDRMALLKATQDSQQQQRYHPGIEQVHYLGHVSRVLEPAQPVFMGPGGRKERRSASNLSKGNDDTFWLDRPQFSAPEIPQSMPPLSAPSAPSHDRAFHPGVRHDDFPVDWVGWKRRGNVVPDDLVDDQAGEARSWFFG